ncbi:uncharacterized protein LOC141733350 isoform X1 [Larus michahellis]|uniref:uncharacterized protein LOC141733350 isoform X1 n=1 Tax=Larus michahellis TaxID=119627 RepID=UPI003D9AB5CC
MATEKQMLRILKTSSKGGGFVWAGVCISADRYSEERMESSSPKREPRLSPCLARDGQGRRVLVLARHAEKGEQEALPALRCCAQLWSPGSPSRHVQSSQVRMARAERRRATGRRAEPQPRGAQSPVFLHGAPHLQPDAHTPRGVRRCPAPSHPPGTTAVSEPQQPPLSTAASPQLQEPSPTPAATPRARTAAPPVPAPLRVGPNPRSKSNRSVVRVITAAMPGIQQFWAKLHIGADRDEDAHGVSRQELGTGPADGPGERSLPGGTGPLNSEPLRQPWGRYRSSPPPQLPVPAPQLFVSVSDRWWRLPLI